MPAAARRKFLGWRMVGAACLVDFIAVGFFFYSGSKHVGDYKMVDEVMVAPSQYQGKDMKVHGWVEPGSIQEDIIAQETVRTFVLEHNGKRIRVRNKGPKPDSFRDRSEVVAQGKIIDENGEPVMVATEQASALVSRRRVAKRNHCTATHAPTCSLLASE